MLMRAHFLPQLLQSEAYTGGLIFLLPDKAQRGCRVSARPVVASACVHKRVRSHASVRRSVLRCVWLFFFYQGLIRVPPDAAAICSPANQRPQQNASPSEPRFTGGLPVCQYYSDSHCALPPGAAKSHKGKIFPFHRLWARGRKYSQLGELCLENNYV